MQLNSIKISVKEKIGYALGDTAANLVFQFMIMFQLVFYTDTFGISAAAAGVLLLIVRLWDAVFDPMMGVIADKTNTRWGKFRPWVLWTAVPFGLMAFLTFLTPDLDPTGKLVYAYITYILLMTIYSANNLPYSALSGVITGDLGERTSLSQYRFVFAMIAQLIIQGLVLPMVTFFGHGDSATGYQWTIGIFSIMAIILFVITFSTTKERIQPPPEQKATVGEHFKDLSKNKPWVVMFLFTLILFITLSMRGSIVIYYFRYFVQDESYFSWFNVFGTISTIIGIFFSKRTALKYGKKNVFIWGLSFTVLFTLGFVFLPAMAVPAMFVMEILRQFAYGFTIPLLWAMMADVADWSEWKNKRRATGIIFSAIVFALKAGLGFGGAISAWILDFYGYIAPEGDKIVTQTPETLQGIVFMMSIFPAITFGIGVLLLFFYPIDKNLEIQVTNDLAERRKGYAVEPA